ncbi:unnamed protein product [Euphydryas editha]|uniref:Uncharacterized protein n=1 Tax=Euphydryas editha TaxID=104508 RepID=A0AAU9V1X9_EUPED|nr:unnamed protein product [Euphydryas editha]
MYCPKLNFKFKLQQRPSDVNLQQMCELNGHEVIQIKKVGCFVQNINSSQYERRHPESASKVPKRCYSFSTRRFGYQSLITTLGARTTVDIWAQ